MEEGSSGLMKKRWQGNKQYYSSRSGQVEQQQWRGVEEKGMKKGGLEGYRFPERYTLKAEEAKSEYSEDILSSLRLSKSHYDPLINTILKPSWTKDLPHKKSFYDNNIPSVFYYKRNMPKKYNNFDEWKQPELFPEEPSYEDIHEDSEAEEVR